MRKTLSLIVLSTALIGAALATSCAKTPAQSVASSASKSDSVLSGLDRREGVLDLYVDTAKNRVLARLPDADDDGVMVRLIYTARLTAGLGSNPVGLDRGWGDSGQIVTFRRAGDKVILETENLAYRANPNNPLEERAVKESFARSFLASFEIVGEKGGGVIDMTEFLSGDRLGLVQHLKDSDQGSFSLSKDRSFVDVKNVFAFPDNVEFDVFLTLSTSDPGDEVETTAANGKDVTFIQHHSFARLPDDRYEPLFSDPRAGVIEQVYYDYSAPLSSPIETRLARRYRLQKDENGKTIKPIVFYIDPGAPEPIRSALLDGARWWEAAFAQAGYPDGYRVEILPEDAHPLDIRYNVVQWVHRQTRGWSYGGGVSDPRTGEMLKGHVNLGSLRVRQDRMIFEGLAGTAKTGTGSDDDPTELALDRIRQLSAHEVGHALGFAHNFAASSYDKGSVMDYPAPDVRVVDGALDFSQTYGVGVGAWDKFAAQWLYGAGDAASREALIKEAASAGLSYVADNDGRSISAGHAQGSVWDNGVHPVHSLVEALRVRRIALDNFGEDRIHKGQPRAELNKVIVPIYLYHRYQTAAAGKLIGGMTFNYGLAGDGSGGAKIAPAGLQIMAIDAVLATLDPMVLDIKDETLALLTPSLVSYSFADSDRELFKSPAFPAFDVSAAADTAASLSFDVLLDPVRAARMNEFARRDAAYPSFEAVLQRAERKVLRAPKEGREAAIVEAVRARYAYKLMALIDGDAVPAVKAQASAALASLGRALATDRGAHSAWLRGEISAFLGRPREAAAPITSARPLPPGSPIGLAPFGQFETCWHCEELMTPQ